MREYPSLIRKSLEGMPMLITPLNQPSDHAHRHGTATRYQTAGYVVMEGYWKDPKRTAEATERHPDEPGIVWMRTGDIGIMDEEGYVRIVGRSKDVIIRGGESRHEATRPSIEQNSGWSAEPGADVCSHLPFSLTPASTLKISRRESLPAQYRKVS